MWVLALFDLPTETRRQKTNYRRFREKLLQDGFLMLQYSVYARPCPSAESALQHADWIESHIPPEGQVRLLTLTSQQYGRMKCFLGEMAKDPEKEPEQLSFF